MSDALDANLSVIVGISITDAMLISSTASATEVGISDWAPGTTYAPGAKCVRNHRIYESANTGNIAKDPAVPANLVGTPPFWIDDGPTNRWAMFDGEVNTQTVVASPLTVVLRPGPFNALYLGAIDGDWLTITVRDAPAGAVIYSYSAALEASDPPDYEEFFYGRFSPQTDFLASSLETYYAMEITVTITRTGGNVACGMLDLGDRLYLGQTQYGAKAKPKSYAYVDTDKFGKTKVVPGKSATDISASAQMSLTDANGALAVLRSILGVPSVLICTNIPEYGALRGFGLINGELTFDEYQNAKISVEMEGMI